ncbi:hypothetical protein DPX16_18531 [Anabarilius grahami]|uniref:Uncharacterized protein n=1 Tax=Anabarilius grahami TaxID=495550 RepID=A0A3N0YZ13_ANAGA|nr:hypothetical protein DPX16_18531 [Anabarilius grahami]
MGLSDVNGRNFLYGSAHTPTRAREHEHAHQRAFGFTEVVGSAAQVTGLHQINNVTKEKQIIVHLKSSEEPHPLKHTDTRFRFKLSIALVGTKLFLEGTRRDDVKLLASKQYSPRAALEEEGEVAHESGLKSGVTRRQTKKQYSERFTTRVSESTRSVQPGHYKLLLCVSVFHVFGVKVPVVSARHLC